jgi:hypothetical protein
MVFEKIAREVIEKHDILLRPGECLTCDMCSEHQRLLMRANLQVTSLVRGLVTYLEKMKNDRREKRRRHKENVYLRKTQFSI